MTCVHVYFFSTLDALRRHPIPVCCVKLDWLVHRLKRSLLLPPVLVPVPVPVPPLQQTVQKGAITATGATSTADATTIGAHANVGVSGPTKSTTSPTPIASTSATKAATAKATTTYAPSSHFIDSYNNNSSSIGGEMEEGTSLSQLLDSQYVTGAVIPPLDINKSRSSSGIITSSNRTSSGGKRWSHPGTSSASTSTSRGDYGVGDSSQDQEYEVGAPNTTSTSTMITNSSINTPSKRRRPNNSNVAFTPPVTVSDDASARTAATEIIHSGSHAGAATTTSHRYVSQFDSPAHFGLTFSQSTPTTTTDSQVFEVTPQGAKQHHFEVSKVSAYRRMPRMRDPNVLLDELNELSKPSSVATDNYTTSSGTSTNTTNTSTAKRPLNPFVGRSNRRSDAKAPQDSQVVVFDSLSQL